MTPALINRLRDVQAACREMESFTTGRMLDELFNDRGFQLIIHKLLEIVGEALNQARKIEPSIVDALPDAHRYIAVSHQITHGYDSIGYKILWTIATERIPELSSSLYQTLTEFEPTETSVDEAQ
jgi:uncharacterized protein with HEPN domain